GKGKDKGAKGSSKSKPPADQGTQPPTSPTQSWACPQCVASNHLRLAFCKMCGVHWQTTAPKIPPPPKTAGTDDPMAGSGGTTEPPWVNHGQQMTRCQQLLDSLGKATETEGCTIAKEKAQTAMSKHDANIGKYRDQIAALEKTIEEKRSLIADEETQISECQQKIAEQVAVVQKLAPSQTAPEAAQPPAQGAAAQRQAVGSIDSLLGELNAFQSHLSGNENQVLIGPMQTLVATIQQVQQQARAESAAAEAQ
ncbi:unnamed protein product, partial [Prorocentrum cordatum]